MMKLLNFDALIAEELREGLGEVVGGFDTEGETDGALARFVL